MDQQYTATGTTGRTRTRRRRWAAVPVVVGGIGLYELVRRAVELTGNPNLVPALLLLGAAVIPVGFVAFVSGRRMAGVGAGTIALTALVGGVVGVVTAGSLESGLLRAEGTLPTIAVGLIEEMAKLLVPLVVLAGPVTAVGSGSRTSRAASPCSPARCPGPDARTRTAPADDADARRFLPVGVSRPTPQLARSA